MGMNRSVPSRKGGLSDEFSKRAIEKIPDPVGSIAGRGRVYCKVGDVSITPEAMGGGV